MQKAPSWLLRFWLPPGNPGKLAANRCWRCRPDPSGSAWREAGTGWDATGAGFTFVAGMVVDGSGGSTVVWYDDNDEIYAARATGGDWVELGGSATGGPTPHGSSNSGAGGRSSAALLCRRQWAQPAWEHGFRRHGRFQIRELK